MSEEIKGGDSSVTTVSDGFGFGGDTSNVVAPASVPPIKVEDSAPDKKGDGQVLVKEETKEEVKTETKQDEGKIFQKKASEKHEQVIDLLADKLEQFKSGKVDGTELKEWFTAHPELAETANRSKRVKDDYRLLMEKSVATQESQPGKDQKDEDEIRPMTLADLKAYDSEREAITLAKVLQSERQRDFTEFAVEHKVFDQDAEALKRNAEALYKANSEWDYSQAVQAAYNALNPRKASPANVSAPTGGVTMANETVAPKVDASSREGVQLMTASEWSGGQLK